MTNSILGELAITPSKEGDQTAINPANSVEQKLSAAINERTRTPMSVPRPKLSSPEIPGFHVHWLNDDGGRIEQAMQAGYDFVSRDEAVLISSDLAGSGVGSGSDLGSRVSLVVGETKNGEPMRAYLMKIRQDWYDADQAMIQERVNDSERTIKSGRQKADGDTAADIAARYVKTHDRKVNFNRSA